MGLTRRQGNTGSFISEKCQKPWFAGQPLSAQLDFSGYADQYEYLGVDEYDYEGYHELA